MARKKTTAESAVPVAEPSKPKITKPSFKVGDSVYIKGGAHDVSGRAISAMYAGARSEFTIHAITKDGCYILRKGCVNAYIVTADAIEQTYQK